MDSCLQRLIKAKLADSDARAFQFRDVGYLDAIKDPLGLSIELLQTTFEGNLQGKKSIEVVLVFRHERNHKGGEKKIEVVVLIQ